MNLKITTANVADLVPYARNAKQHPDWQIKQIAASITEFGMNDPIAIWHDPTQHNAPVIVEGHGRVLALQQLGVKTCPVICLDHLTDEQRRAYALVHNKLTMNTTFDLDMLNMELEDLGPDIDLSEFDLRVTMPDELPSPGDAPDETDALNHEFGVIISCSTEKEQDALLKRFIAEGLNCRAVI